MFKDKNFLITGGTGFLGTSICKRILNEGAFVRSTHFSQSPSFQHPRLEWVHANLEDQLDCSKICTDIDYIIMCAASTSGAADIVQKPLIHLTPNIIMNARMLEAAYTSNAKCFVFMSSAAAYPTISDRLLKEDDMFLDDPADVYFTAGWMKRYGEILCRNYSLKLAPSMKTIVIRPSNVYGPGDKFDLQRSHVTAALIRKVIERQKPLVIWGNGDNERDLIYIEDFIDGVLLALKTNEKFLTINIASGKTYSIKKILQTIIEQDNYLNAELMFDETQPQTVGKLMLDITLAKNILNFSPKTSLEDGIKNTIEWYRSSIQ